MLLLACVPAAVLLLSFADGPASFTAHMDQQILGMLSSYFGTSACEKAAPHLPLLTPLLGLIFPELQPLLPSILL